MYGESIKIDKIFYSINDDYEGRKLWKAQLLIQLLVGRWRCFFAGLNSASEAGFGN